jgi:hypothetical protein
MDIQRGQISLHSKQTKHYHKNDRERGTLVMIIITVFTLLQCSIINIHKTDHVLCFALSGLCWEVIVRFVDIGEILHNK